MANDQERDQAQRDYEAGRDERAAERARLNICNSCSASVDYELDGDLRCENCPIELDDAPGGQVDLIS